MFVGVWRVVSTVTVLIIPINKGIDTLKKVIKLQVGMSKYSTNSPTLWLHFVIVVFHKCRDPACSTELQMVGTKLVCWLVFTSHSPSDHRT